MDDIGFLLEEHNQLDWENLIDFSVIDTADAPIPSSEESSPLVVEGKENDNAVDRNFPGAENVQESSELNVSPPEEAVPSWIEELLMNDDTLINNEELLMGDGIPISNKEFESHHFEFCDSLLLDFPTTESITPSSPKVNDKAPDGQKICEDSVQNYGSNSNSEKEQEQEQEKLDSLDENSNEDENDCDPMSKKRKRQLRNRDAAMRSRERKKMYVKDLELRSRYLEAECRRLGRFLQCCTAENHMLRLSLTGGSAFGASMTRAESAVLLLESLLLGSLLWFLGIMCLFPLSRLLLSTQEAVLLENEDKKEQESVVLRRTRSRKLIELWVPLSFLKSKRCRASWTKMKSVLDAIQILV